jgi:predicted aspartyl protease
MGFTELSVRIAKPGDPGRVEALEMLVDSGAMYSVVPAVVLARLGIEPDRRERFRLADGTSLRRDVGSAFFEIAGRRGASPVIFGRRHDSVLLGVVTLESLGLMLDPIRRRLKPLPLRLGALGSFAAVA